MLKVDIEGITPFSLQSGRGKSKPLRKDFIRKIVRKVFNKKGWVGIVFCDEKKIRRLNRRYRKVDRVTDVLTFPFKDRYSREFLGEIYICLPRALRQAKSYGHSLEEEVKILLTHGLKSLRGQAGK